MKKKGIAAVLVLTCAMSTPVYAKDLNVNEDKVESEAKVEEEQGISSEDLNIKDENKGILDTGSTDVVTINDDVYEVKTDLLDCQLCVPYGWLCFTQDLEQQYDIYSSVFNDPMAAAKEMVSSGEHYFLLDYDFENDVDIIFTEDYLGSLVGNAADLSKEDNETIFQIVNDKYFTGLEGEAEQFDKNRFYHFWNEDESVHIYETFVNSVCVDIYVRSMNEEEISEDTLEDIEYMLTEMSFK